MTVYDITIVGAGVVGTAIARALSRYDLSVALVDGARDVGEGTSKANTAILHTGFDAKPGTLESQLVRRGYELLGDYADRTGIPVERTGAVLVAWTEQELADLPGLRSKAVDNGYDRCELLTAAQVYEMVPSLGPGALGGLSVPDESIICPWTPSVAFATEAVANGVTLLLGHEVTGVGTGDDGTTRLHTGRGEITTRWLVNAAGLGADVLDRALGHDRFTVTPRRGQLLVFDKLARGLVDTIVLPVPSKLGKGVLVSPTVYGNVMLGPTAEDLDDKRATGTTGDGFEFLRTKGERLVPALFEEEVTTAYAGLRASIDHGDYLITLDPDRRYLLVGGIRSTGLTASMGIAEWIEDMLHESSGITLDKKADVAAPPRMPMIGEAQPRPYRRGDLISADPAYGEIVCFCERVTAGEIRDALHTPVPATDRAGLARRTRATNGRCQGFYCGAEVDARLTQNTGAAS
ncbi:NAD(P)/FAD-dependent oxidoreductase [Pseudonocardia parietis]|uniref:Glycerol-3-phosphate dehydrogenase n=1 Tax=Pseudonocardia parietis TaxID=570936 RepID=A0ABS4VSR5_9PSEU|nr:NAD(P)/FAD-dependent oxidoreductase [Pseudonocardia parietis]MBP2366951.1 glycerol-3-phosphate dehydrogenase [Pseudonocardia parietis]